MQHLVDKLLMCSEQEVLEKVQLNLLTELLYKLLEVGGYETLASNLIHCISSRDEKEALYKLCDFRVYEHYKVVLESGQIDNIKTLLVAM